MRAARRLMGTTIGDNYSGYVLHRGFGFVKRLSGRHIWKRNFFRSCCSLRIRHVDVAAVAERLKIVEVVMAARSVPRAVARLDVIDFELMLARAVRMARASVDELRLRDAAAPATVFVALDSGCPRGRPLVLPRDRRVDARRAVVAAPPPPPRRQAAAARIAAARLMRRHFR